MCYYQLFLQHRMGFRPSKDSTARQDTLTKDNIYILMGNIGIRIKLMVLYLYGFIIIITFIRLSMYKFLILFRLSVTCQTLNVLAEKINSQMFKNSKSFVSQKIYANIVGCDKITIAIFSKCLTLD